MTVDDLSPTARTVADQKGKHFTEDNQIHESDSSVSMLARSKGNAATDSQAFRGWLLGHFIPKDLGCRATDDVEVKWGVHAPGEGQDEWSVNRTATTISILLRGKDRIIFPEGEIVLEREGDYAIWGPGVPHRWRAVDHCVVMTVRWPSVSDDSFTISDKDAKAQMFKAR
jgi:hypothetical protein